MGCIYDKLRKKVDSVGEVSILDYGIGPKFTYVKTSQSLGIAKTNLSQRFDQQLIWKEKFHISDFVSCLNSWNYMESSLGLAALNSVSLIEDETKIVQCSLKDHIALLSRLYSKKKVLMIEGTTYEENAYKNICKLSVLKKEPLQGDYPSTALEYIVQDNSVVHISGTCLVDKTIPRILSISLDKQIILDGIDVPVTPLFFEEGVAMVFGFMADDIEKCINYIKLGYNEEALLSCGHIYGIYKEENRVEN